MKHVFIVNPVSGKADASVFLAPKLVQAASDAGCECEVVCTERAGHATELAHTYAAQGAPVRLYACGGDGTLNEVLRGAYPYPNAEVGSIPCGSGNDFVRSFGVPEDFLNLADNLAGTAVPIDLIEANDGVSAAICSVGVDSEVAYRIPKYRRLPFCGGTLAYNISIAERMLQPLSKRLRIRLDDMVLEGDYLITTVCNGVAYGGGYKAAPMADLQDGILDVILVKKIGRLRVAGVLGKYKKGLHIRAGDVAPEYTSFMSYHRARKVSIEEVKGKPVVVNIDGECAPAQGLHAAVLPLAARFVLPASLYNTFSGRKESAEAPV